MQNRIKKDWPGLTFPGGHVEDDENCEEACVREVKEETNLDIKNIECVGYIEWNEINARHLSILFKTNDFSGQLTSSKEGPIFFIKGEDLKNYSLSNDFEKIYKKMIG